MVELEKSLAAFRGSLHGVLSLSTILSQNSRRPFFWRFLINTHMLLILFLSISIAKDASQNMQKVSSSIQRLCVAQPPPHNYIPFDGQKKTGIAGSHAAGYGSSKGMQDGYEKGQKGRLKDEDLMRNLRGDSQISELENSENDGMCWKEDCHGRSVF
jgi:hypothetical protein